MIFHIFTAHMTGATVHLAQSAMEAHWSDAVHGAAVVLSFVAGSVIGRVLIEYGVRKRLRRIGSVNLLLESALIAAVMIRLSVHIHSLEVATIDRAG